MLKGIIGLFRPQKKHRDFFSKHTNLIRHLEWLAIDYNPNPNGPLQDNINYKNDQLDEKLSIETHKTHAILNINGDVHEYKSVSTFLFKFLSHKDLIILSAIEGFKQKLENN